MSQIQLEQALYELALENTTYSDDVLYGIRNTIVRFFCNNPGYIGEDAIKTFKYFLKTGVLNFSL